MIVPKGKRKVLGPRFFARPTLAVARGLLGMWVVRRKLGREVAAMINEVEAYDGPRDRASHASRGRTPRNAPMFGPPGRWYVYLCYGMHWMLNVVTGPRDYPAAVLIRGVEGAAGPGRATKLLGVTGKFDGLTSARATGLWIEDRGTRPPRSRVRRAPRIGVDYAGPDWAARPYRFYLETEPAGRPARK